MVQKPEYVPRRVEALVMDSLRSFRVVVLHGPRQAGKTTIAQSIAANIGAGYVSLDDDDQLFAAEQDPKNFLDEIGHPAVIDEIQRAGQRLVLALKLAVDRNNDKGQYLLTGSTNFLTVPAISETLAGRTDIIEVWPFAVGETLGGSNNFVNRLFAESEKLTKRKIETLDRKDYLKLICVGGFPEVQNLDESSRRRWFERYAKTVIQREIDASSGVVKPDAMEKLSRYFAVNTAQELVVSEAARRLSIDPRTADSYTAWLQTLFLINVVPSWSRNLTSKVVRRPKIHFADTGIAASVMHKDITTLSRATDPATGPLIESFVANELTKQLGWLDTSARLYHYRDRRGPEIDLIIEKSNGDLAAIEIKATTSPRATDFKWMENMRNRLDLIGNDFKCGIVFHTGNHRITFGDRLIALPISDIWA